MTTESADQVDTLESLLLEKLAESGLPDPVVDVVLAALGGPEELQAVLTGKAKPSRAIATATAAEAEAVAGIYLRSIDVEGFRGIGNPTTLTLTPGPGLTLVTGRNGSGKSSFAESVELAMTGQNKRWAPPRSAIWRDAWRNLHHPDTSRIAVELAIDGRAGTTRLTREWAAGDALEAGTSFCQPVGEPRRSLAEMGWERPLEFYRPFLSYAELGALVDGKPSEMYDALARILGLDELAEAEKLLVESRKGLDSTVKAAAAALPALQHLLEGRSEPRAERIRNELATTAPDLEMLAGIVAAGALGDDGTVGAAARAILALVVPDESTAQAAVARVVEARAAVTALAGGSAEEARRLAKLLATALEHQVQHPGGPCPVCAGRTLDEAWADATRDEVERLQGLASAADSAHRESEAALSQMRQLVGPLPPVLTVTVEGLDLRPATDAWASWLAVVTNPDVEVMVAGAVSAHERISHALIGLRADAATLVQQQVAAWEPVVVALSTWIDRKRRATQAKHSLVQIKLAIEWLKRVGQDIRDARLAPFAETSASVWSRLRQESNVELGPIHLSGISTSTQRKVALDVTIDGVAGAALAVMSQGELHALGLALFLPRAAAAASPFRFLVIDDPVQSMDPAKVDGLARVLADVATTRQVVVFSHDDRLTEAVRRLELPATIWEVIRGEGSAVQVLKNDDPIGRYLSDARAIAKTDQLSVQAQALVVVGMCRGALEAACHQRIRTQKLATGVRHLEIEKAIDAARTLHQSMALALFDDVKRGSEVLGKLAAGFGGQPAVRAFKAAKTGVHEPYQGDLSALIGDVSKLALRVRG